VSSAASGDPEKKMSASSEGPEPNLWVVRKFKNQRLHTAVRVKANIYGVSVKIYG
jgi:hypothetical protein